MPLLYELNLVDILLYGTHGIINVENIVDVCAHSILRKVFFSLIRINHFKCGCRCVKHGAANDEDSEQQQRQKHNYLLLQVT